MREETAATRARGRTILPAGEKRGMKYVLQIFTGSWNEAGGSPEEIIRKIREISSRIPVDKVIIGWSTDPALYREVGSFLHAHGIRMLLWLPVFSEAGRTAGADAALDLFGKPVPPPALQDGEGFIFSCPSSRRNRRIVTDLYETRFSGCGFDGVFLDRIRSQSFLSGVSGVLSCGCERCRKAFLEKGVDPDAVAKRYEQEKDSFFDMASFPMNGRFVLKDRTVQRFFDAKEEIIAEAAAELSGYFRNRGLIVGLDLFAPLVSRFVGQNYALLSRCADFIKPMLYLRTDAPAGIGYEYALYEKHAPGARGRIRISPDTALLYSQLAALREVPCEQDPGIEINYDRDLVRTDAGYITESLAAIRDRGFERAALCWNILQAPAALLDAVYAGETGRSGR